METAKSLQPFIVRVKSRYESGFQTCMDLLLIVALAAAIFGVAGFGLVMTARADLDVHKYCVSLDGSKVLPKGAGNPPAYAGDRDGYAFGDIKIDLNDNKLSISLVFSGLDTVSGLKIYGPLSDSNPINAPVTLPSDGSSYVDASDALSGTGNIHKSFSIERSTAQSIVDNPGLYYVRVDTNVFPSGAIRASLGSDCRLRDN
jgi:hypothetical protein